MLAGMALFVNLAFAVDPARAMSQYVVDHWGPEKGFPRGPVYAIAQTRDGYLWIGTEAGLVRFDGIQFVTVTDESKTVQGVLGLAVDSEDNLWVRLKGATLLRYRHGVFDDANMNLGMPHSNATAMWNAEDRGLLAARLEPGVVSRTKGKFEVLAAAHPLARSPVISLAQTGDASIWMGTRDAGLFRFANQRVTSVSQGLPDTKINYLLPDGERNLWIGTDYGVALWTGTALTPTGIPDTMNRFQTLALKKDRDANIWVGTDSRGLLRLNSQGVSSLEFREAVTAIFEDREGSLWIGSAGGLDRLRDSTFVTYSDAEGLPAYGSVPIFVDEDTRLWFAPNAGGLWWAKDGQSGKITQEGLANDVIYSIAGRAGELWLGRQNGGLTRLREGTAARTFTKADGLAQDSVYSVHISRDGAVWAGTLSGGVSRLQNGVFTTFTSADGLASNTVASILDAADGTMWFATPTGLSALAANGTWKGYGEADGLPSANVLSLLQDSAGIVWVGTGAGLAFRDSKGFHIPGQLPLHLREQILGMAEDRSGNLWLSTLNHLLRVNRDKLMRGALGDGDIREYGIADGLRGVEGVKRHRSVVTESGSGRIWFSMNRGISVVDPGRLARASAPSIVHVQAITADGKDLGLQHGAAVRVPPGQQRITFRFIGLSLSVPERVRYRYTLDGFDPGWSEPLGSREAVYTNLGPGPYRFRVIASNGDGVWDSSEAILPFEVSPAMWQTLWFRFGLAAVCGLGILAAYRVRLRSLTGQLSMRFEERLAERSHIARELHDTLLQGFLSASMQLHVVADSLPEDSAAKPRLGRVLELVGQVIEEGRNTVRGLRSVDLPSYDPAQSLSRIPHELGEDTSVRFRVVVEGQSRLFMPVARDEVYRIAREAVMNAFRHAKAANIEVELEYTSRQFRLLVRDDGCGMEPGVLAAGREGHWGLRGMRERSERIGGRLRLWSRLGAGTEVELSVPGSHVYERGSVREDE